MTLNKNDKAYWSHYYENQKAPEIPSPFALEVHSEYCKPRFVKKSIEFGFGNGRDLKYFTNSLETTDGIELAPGAASLISESLPISSTVVEGSFTDMNLFKENEGTYDMVYSRFTLHSVDKEAETLALKNANRLLQKGGLLAIEARTIYDDFCGKGEKISDNEWIYEDHYRRFLDPGDTACAVQEAGFKIESLTISDQFAPYKDQAPVCLRLIARKIA